MWIWRLELERDPGHHRYRDGIVYKLRLDDNSSRRIWLGRGLGQSLDFVLGPNMFELMKESTYKGECVCVMCVILIIEAKKAGQEGGEWSTL